MEPKSKSKPKVKPEFFLVPVNTPARQENLVALFKSLTGRDLTDKEILEIQALQAKDALEERV